MKSKIQKELNSLNDARHLMLSRMHYSTIDSILAESGLPYQLVQDWYDDCGKSLRNYRYRFTSKWGSDAALYIQETEAGKPRKSMWDAMDALERVLTEYLGKEVS